MSQNDFVIGNQTAPNFRSDLNSALQALASLSSGSTAPTTTYANMLWYDTANNILKMRSDADDAWANVGYLDQATNKFFPYIGATQVDFKDEDDMASDSATAVPSQQSVKAYVDNTQNTQIGVGQTWQDVSGSRSYGTSYQNTTGKPIMVSCYGPDNSEFQVSTDGSTWLTLGQTDTDQDSGAQPGGFIVPNGTYYRNTGSGSIIRWVELR